MTGVARFNAEPSSPRLPGNASTSPRTSSRDTAASTAQHPSHPIPRAATLPVPAPAGPHAQGAPKGPTAARGVGPSFPSLPGLCLAAAVMVAAGAVLAGALRLLSMALSV